MMIAKKMRNQISHLLYTFSREKKKTPKYPPPPPNKPREARKILVLFHKTYYINVRILTHMVYIAENKAKKFPRSARFICVFTNVGLSDIFATYYFRFIFGVCHIDCVKPFFFYYKCSFFSSARGKNVVIMVDFRVFLYYLLFFGRQNERSTSSDIFGTYYFRLLWGAVISIVVNRFFNYNCSFFFVGEWKKCCNDGGLWGVFILPSTA